MASLLYEQIYSSLLRKITDYDFLRVSRQDAEDQLNEYLHSVISKPYCRRLFSSISFDDELKELEYELKQTTDESQDEDFVIEMLSLGMLIEWTRPQLNSKLLQQQMITSSKESKFYSQAMHITELRQLLDDVKKEQKDLIRDRGYIYNPYLGGKNG